MTESDTDPETITGGYYVEVDNNASREPYWFNSSHGNPISVHEPDEEVMQYQQFQYIRNAWNNMEDIVFGADYADPEKGMRSVLDMETFIRHILTSEFNGNTDMLCQVFLYKERGDDHFYTGPVWDADLALENDQTTYPANQRMDWTYKVRDTGNWTQFVDRVLSDPSAFAYMQEMWAKLRKKDASSRTTWQPTSTPCAKRFAPLPASTSSAGLTSTSGSRSTRRSPARGKQRWTACATSCATASHGWTPCSPTARCGRRTASTR